MISVLFIFCALGLAIRLMMAVADSSGKKRYHLEEYERYERVIQRDPTQAGSIAALAELYYRDGDTGKAVELWRDAIRTLPYGPFTETWKRQLKRALAEFEAEQRGENPRDYANQRACTECQALILASDKICPKCGAVNSMSALEYLSQKEVARSWARETLILCVALWIAGIIFSFLPLEVKGAIIISSLIVLFIVIMRTMDGSVA